MKRPSLLPAVAPLVLLAAWFAIALTPWATHHAVPRPGEVLAVARTELLTVTLWRDLGATLARTAAGVGLAATLGAALGFLLGRSPTAWRASEPTVDFLRSIPPILSYPLFLLALGYGESARIAAVAFGSTGIVLLHVARALAQVPRARVDTVKLAGLRGLAAVRALYLYESLPALFTGVRLAFTAGLIVVVVSEMLTGAHYGLGVRAQEALLEYRADLLWLVILVAGLATFAISGTLAWAERRYVHWAGR
ncbi:MAG: ABC transporter permease subunit [Deltaproteobacteria bacterium]